MDFVVVGLGLGALGMLVGVLMLGWVARRWERAASRAATPDDAAHDYAMAIWRRDSGQALLGASSAVLLATIGALAGSLDDRTGAYFVTTTATVAALGLLVWAYLYRSRNPLPPRRRTRPAGADTLPVPASAERVMPLTSGAGVVPPPPAVLAEDDIAGPRAELEQAIAAQPSDPMAGELAGDSVAGVETEDEPALRTEDAESDDEERTTSNGATTERPKLAVLLPFPAGGSGSRARAEDEDEGSS